MALVLVFFFLFGAFILIPGGYGLFFFLGTSCLSAAFSMAETILLMSSIKELAFTALQCGLLVFFGKVYHS